MRPRFTRVGREYYLRIPMGDGKKLIVDYPITRQEAIKLFTDLRELFTAHTNPEKKMHD